tara:strand:- start:166 stop:663 length:498 start_codon:yes stop_codon:yes gene_type:complete
MAHYEGHTDPYAPVDAGSYRREDIYEESREKQKNEKALSSANFGGDFRTYGEEDLFTKITKGMKEATEASTYRPFFEIQREGSEKGLLGALDKTGYTKGGQARNFEGSGGETSMYEAIMGDYGGKVMDYIGQMQTSAMEGQQRLDEIIRANKLQSFQLKQLEEGG